MKIPLALEGPLRNRNGPDHTFVKNLSNGLITPCGNLEKVPTRLRSREWCTKGLQNIFLNQTVPSPNPKVGSDLIIDKRTAAKAAFPKQQAV